MRERRRRSRGLRFLSNLAAEVQPLEPRTLPTGTVTATLSGQNLTIGGDNLDNSILIEVKTTGIFLTGLQDANSDPAKFTKIKFGTTTNDAGTEVSLTTTPSLKNLTILMYGGNDNVRINVGEDGADAPVATITGRLQINLGSGDDHGVLLLNDGSLTISGNLEGDLGNGNDCLLSGTLEQLDAGSTVQAPIQVGGNVIVLGRLGDDLIGLGGLDVKKSVQIVGDDGADSMLLRSVAVTGNLLLNGNRGNDDMVLDGVTVTGATTIHGDNGNDQLVIESFSAGKNVAVSLGNGDDQVMLTETPTLGATAKVTFDGGAGADQLKSSDVLADPPYKLRGIEDPEASLLDPTDLLAAIDDLITSCLAATA